MYATTKPVTEDFCMSWNTDIPILKKRDRQYKKSMWEIFCIFLHYVLYIWLLMHSNPAKSANYSLSIGKTFITTIAIRLRRKRGGGELGALL